MKDILIEISTQGLVEMHEYIETGPICSTEIKKELIKNEVKLQSV